MRQLLTKTICVAIICLWSDLGYAQSECKVEFKEPPKYFTDTYQMSISIAMKYCQPMQGAELESMLTKWKATILREATPLMEAGVDLRTHIEKLSELALDQSKGPILSASQIASRFIFMVDRSGLEDGTFGMEINERCVKNSPQKIACFGLLEDLKRAINAYKNSVVGGVAKDALQKQKSYTAEWEDYFMKARSQTVIEHGINSWIFKDEIQKPGFTLPPAYQAIVLHPNILMEYVGAANQGSRFKSTLAVEWVGINYWNRDVPLGISLMTSYADRAGAKTMGHGVLLHINNKYSIGLTQRKGKIGYSISLDLLKLFETKQSQLERYQLGVKP